MATFKCIGTLQPFRNGDSEAVKYYRSSYGEYANFVIVEHRYKKLPLRFMCTVENALVQKLRASNLQIGDSIDLTGELEGYTMDRNGTKTIGTKVVVYNFEFVQSAMRSSKKSEKEKERNLEDCDIFQDSMN